MILRDGTFLKSGNGNSIVLRNGKELEPPALPGVKLDVLATPNKEKDNTDITDLASCLLELSASLPSTPNTTSRPVNLEPTDTETETVSVSLSTISKCSGYHGLQDKPKEHNQGTGLKAVQEPAGPPVDFLPIVSDIGNYGDSGSIVSVMCATQKSSPGYHDIDALGTTSLQLQNFAARQLSEQGSEEPTLATTEAMVDDTIMTESIPHPPVFTIQVLPGRYHLTVEVKDDKSGALIKEVEDQCHFKNRVSIGDRILSIGEKAVKSIEDFKVDTDKPRKITVQAASRTSKTMPKHVSPKTTTSSVVNTIPASSHPWAQQQPNHVPTGKQITMQNPPPVKSKLVGEKLKLEEKIEELSKAHQELLDTLYATIGEGGKPGNGKGNTKKSKSKIKTSAWNVFRVQLSLENKYGLTFKSPTEFFKYYQVNGKHTFGRRRQHRRGIICVGGRSQFQRLASQKFQALSPRDKALYGCFAKSGFF